MMALERLRERFLERSFESLHRNVFFLERLLECAPDGHGFADTLHLGGKRGVSFGEFLKGEAWDLGDDVVDRRLEARHGLARDVVWQFVESVANRQLGRDFRDRETGRLGG